MAESVQSYEDLQQNLAEYRSQLKQVEDLLLGDHENEELLEMYASLTEVIQLTQELLKDAREQYAATSASALASSSGAPAAVSSLTSSRVVLPPQLNLPSILPASVADQIRKAQVRAAIMGQADAAWAIGAKCQAMYSADGQFYNATVEAVTVGGKFVVNFEGYTDKEEVDLSGIRPMPELAEVYQGVAAPKRKRVEDQPIITEVPKWLEINEGDDEKTKARKKKLIKSYKSKMRFTNMDLQTKGKQDNWKNFMTGKGSKKKTGFFTGVKKESIFKVPDGFEGKVGVVGSGKGLTEYKKQGKHHFELDEQ